MKTRGRMVNGQHVRGQGLQGAMVVVQGGNKVVTQSSNGAFSIAVPSKTFLVQSVQKKGYQLVDADATTKPYQLSSNPLYLVMETPEQQTQDRLDAERKLRRTLQRQLQEREDEIEAMQVSLAEKQRMLQQLYDDQKNNEKLISGEAARMIRGIRADAALTKEQKGSLEKSFLRAYTDRFGGRTEYLDAKLEEGEKSDEE